MRSVPQMLYETNKTSLIDSLYFVEKDIKRCNFNESVEKKLLEKLGEIQSIVNKTKYDDGGEKDEAS